MLTRLYVDNFRTFRNFELKLQPLTLLVGRNGSGKTAVFDVLEKLRRFLVDEEPAANVFLARDLPAWSGETATQAFEFGWEYATIKLGYRLTIEFDSITRKAHVLNEAFDWDGETQAEYKDGRLSLLDHGASEQLAGVEGRFSPRKSVLAVSATLFLDGTGLVGALKTTLAELMVCSPLPVTGNGYATEDVERPNRRLSDFVGWLRHLAQETPEKFTRISASIHAVIPTLAGLRLEKSGDARVLKCLFGVDEAGPTHTLAYDQLSDGQRQLLMLYTLVETCVGPGRTLCVDEPENFLALREIQPWVRMVEDKLQQQGGQCLIASHHPEIIDRLDVANIILFKRGENGATIATSFPTEVVGADMLTASEVLSRSWEEP